MQTEIDDEAKKLQDLKAKIQRANEDIEAGNIFDGETFFREKLGPEEKQYDG